MIEKRFLIILFLAFILIAACVDLNDIVVTTPDMSKIADGKYEGNSKVGPVRVKLEVTMQNGVITSIDIIKHFNGRGEKAEIIVPRVIQAQSLNIDVVSGATASSKALLKAVENALTGK